MLVEFFMERARVEPGADGSSYKGYVPDLPEVAVEAPTPELCRSRLANAISNLLSVEGSGDSYSPQRVMPVSTMEPKLESAQAAEVAAGEEVVSTDGAADETSAEPSFQEIIYEKRDWVARVTINRPDVYNAYTSRTLSEMTEAFRDAARDREVAVVVLTGAGEKAFCTGSDVKEHSEEHLANPEKFREWLGLLVEAHEALLRVGKPTIARINGLVAGGGNEWNLACDLAIAADHSKFMQIEAKVGMVAAMGATQWLPIVVGERRAREMLLTCEPISANKALLWGLVNDVVPLRELDGAVDALCQKLIDRFPQCLNFTRQQVGVWKEFSWEATISRAKEWLTNHFNSPEAVEGMRALVERRATDYREFRRTAEYPDEQEVGAAAQDQPEASDESQVLSEPVFKRYTVRERACVKCGAKGLAAVFQFCGICGSKL